MEHLDALAPHLSLLFCKLPELRPFVPRLFARLPLLLPHMGTLLLRLEEVAPEVSLSRTASTGRYNARSPTRSPIRSPIRNPIRSLMSASRPDSSTLSSTVQRINCSRASRASRLLWRLRRLKCARYIRLPTATCRCILLHRDGPVPIDVHGARRRSPGTRPTDFVAPRRVALAAWPLLTGMSQPTRTAFAH